MALQHAASGELIDMRPPAEKMPPAPTATRIDPDGNQPRTQMARRQ